MNGQGNLQSEKLNTLAQHLGLQLMRRVSLAEHVDKLMESKGRDFWSDEVFNNDEDFDTCQTRYESAEERAAWEPGFRKILAEQEREKLQAIPWIILTN